MCVYRRVVMKRLGLILLISLVVYPVLHRADDADVKVDVEYEQPSLETASGPANVESNIVWSEVDEYGSNFTAADKSSLKETKFTFQAEINRLMSILVNSLYSNRDVFLRELISNASDALDKLRFMMLTKTSESSEESGDLKPQIRIWVDKEKRQLNIRDTGIGMSKEELENNLGKIAKSGTSDFIQKLSLGGENLDSQIGQFGVGFYSAFLVADSVTVTTKSGGHPQYVWRSSSDDSGSYTIAEDPRKDTLKQGTLITLDLKRDANAYMSESKLRSLIHQYSEFINFPIYLRISKTVSEQKAEGEAGAEMPKESEKPDEKPARVDDDEEDDDEEPVMTGEVDVADKKVMYSWELVNNQRPIWTRKSSEISSAEYDEFYKVLNRNDTRTPLTYIHFTAEGDHTFTCLLYIPASSPFNVFDRTEKYHNLRLHVKRVYITDNFDDILPRYLAFLVGLVDSDNMPLNVSREVLQKHRLMNMIRKKIVSKVLGTIEDMFENDRELYDKFYLEYSANLKYGVVDDKKNSHRLMRLLLFNSYRHPKKKITLQQYVNEMPEGQNQIYYIGGESMKTIKGSPLIEPATKKGYDVLYLPSTIDAYTIEVSRSFRAENNVTYSFTDMTKESNSISPEDKKMLEDLEQGEYKPLLDFFSKHMKEYHIGSVKLTNRLHTTPCALIASSNSYSANMERIIKAQYAETMTPLVMKALGKTFEFNVDHPIVQELLRLVKENETETALESLQLLYESAMITSGYSIEHPIAFSRRLHRLVGQNLRIPMDWSVDEPEVGEEEEEQDDNRDKLEPYDTIDADQQEQEDEQLDDEQMQDDHLDVEANEHVDDEAPLMETQSEGVIHDEL